MLTALPSQGSCCLCSYIAIHRLALSLHHEALSILPGAREESTGESYVSNDMLWSINYISSIYWAKLVISGYLNTRVWGDIILLNAQKGESEMDKFRIFYHLCLQEQINTLSLPFQTDHQVIDRKKILKIHTQIFKYYLQLEFCYPLTKLIYGGC